MISREFWKRAWGSWIQDFRKHPWREGLRSLVSAGIGGWFSAQPGWTAGLVALFWLLVGTHLYTVASNYIENGGEN